MGHYPLNRFRNGNVWLRGEDFSKDYLVASPKGGKYTKSKVINQNLMADRIVGVIRADHTEADENFRHLNKDVACTHDTFMCSVSSL